MQEVEAEEKSLGAEYSAPFLSQGEEGMKKVIITGSSNGIGLATAKKFLNQNYEVVGVDTVPAPSCLREHSYFQEYNLDIRDTSKLQSLIGESKFPKDISILVNNAGIQGTEEDLSVNLRGTVDFTEVILKNSLNSLESILFVASASAHSGAEFPEYSASKGGMLAYMKNVARRVSTHGITCNSISPGGVLTDLNKAVIEDKELWSHLMNITPLKKWMSAEECAEWIYFMTVVNKSCTGTDILIDNGENTIPVSTEFVWK